MQEKLTEHDIEDYKKVREQEFDYSIKKVVEINKNYILSKNLIIEKLSHTFLFPYLLEMDYLVGVMDGLQITDDPNECLKWFNINHGVKDQMKIEIDKNSLENWSVFRIQKEIPNKFLTTDTLTVYLLIKIKTDVSYFFFSVFKDNVYNQETTFKFLNKFESIIKTKKLLGINNEANNSQS